MSSYNKRDIVFLPIVEYDSLCVAVSPCYEYIRSFASLPCVSLGKRCVSSFVRAIELFTRRSFEIISYNNLMVSSM